MNRLIISFLLASCLLPCGLVAEPKLADYLPADAWGVIEVEDMEALTKDLEKGPLSEIWESPAMASVRKYLDLEELDFPDSETGEASKELVDRLLVWSEKLSGQIAFSIGGLDDVFKGQQPEDAIMPEIIFLAETKGTAKELAEFAEWFEETDRKVNADDDNIRIEKEKVRGHEVFWMAPEGQADDDEDARIGVFLADGILGMGGGRQTVVDLIERMEKKNDPSIAEHADYREAFDEIGRGDMRIFINLRPVVAAFLEMIKTSEDFNIEENPLGVTMEGLVAALKLEGLECLAIQMDFDERSMEMGSAFFMGKPKGLLRLLQSSGEPVAPVPFIPNDATTAAVSRFDFGLMWDVAMDLLAEISPALHLLVDGQIKVFEKQAGVSLRKDLLGSLGDELVNFSKINPLAEEVLQGEDVEGIEASLDTFFAEFYAISLKDADRFDQSLRTLLGAGAPGAELFEDQKHKGVTVRQMRDQAGASFSYAVTPKWLFINMGDRSRMLQAIARSQKPRKSLWKRPDVADAMDSLPNAYNALEYTDLQVLINMSMPLLQEAIEETTGEKLDIDEMPEMPFFMLTWSKTVRRGMISKMRPYPKDD